MQPRISGFNEAESHALKSALLPQRLSLFDSASMGNRNLRSPLIAAVSSHISKPRWQSASLHQQHHSVRHLKKRDTVFEGLEGVGVDAGSGRRDETQIARATGAWCDSIERREG